MLVRNPLSSPGRADPMLADSHDLKLPDLLRIGDRKTFTTIPVAIFLCQRAHHFDGLPCRGGTLHRQTAELLDDQRRIVVDQGVRPRERRLTDAHLLLVQRWIASVDVGICMRDLRNLSHYLDPCGVGHELGLAPVLADQSHRTGLVILGRNDVHPSVGGAVASVRGHHRPVGARQPPDHNAGALQPRILIILSPSSESRGHKSRQRHKNFSHLYLIVCLFSKTCEHPLT